MTEDESQEIRFSVHPRERILEITYPERLGVEVFDRYEGKIRATILALGAPFDAVVDQRAPILTSPELSERMVALMKWASRNGLRRLVRVVANSPTALLQARRIAKEARIRIPMVVVQTREEAFRWLAEN